LSRKAERDSVASTHTSRRHTQHGLGQKYDINTQKGGVLRISTPP